MYTEDWINDKCDKYDYLIAAFSGITSGFIDIFFVGTPLKSNLCTWTDIQTDNLVKRFAKMCGWNPKLGNENNVASAIGFLERKFPVNYDQAHSGVIDGVFKMSTKNHHYKSLAHSPDIVGLFFSIIDQFEGKSSFIDNGKLIRIETNKQNLGLYGNNFISKLFCGFCNWLGHIMSDMAGSSGGRGKLSGRGSGISIPFMNLFQLCDFGELMVGNNKQTLATVMTEVFEKGYDLRFSMAMTIPVLMNELMIRALWVIKKHFYDNRSWKECIPTDKHSDLRMMLIVGYGALCIMDGADAAIRSGGNALMFILRLNLIAWFRLIILIFKELVIRYGDKVKLIIKTFLNMLKSTILTNEYKLIKEYYARIERLDNQISQQLKEFIEMVNNEYMLIHKEIGFTFDNGCNTFEQGKHSILLAKACNVNDEKIIKTKDDLDDFFMK